MDKKEYELKKSYIPEPLASKDKYTICKGCNIQFSQDWDGSVGKYSSYALCPECRKKASKQKTETYVIDYTPFPYQMEMHNSDARFKLIAGAIRTGKDYSMTFELVKYTFACANEERPATMIPKVRAWIVAPSEAIATEDFTQLRRIIPRELIADWNKTTKSLLTKNGVLYEVKSAYDPESLVGVGLDAVLITEAARIKDLEDVWSNIEGRLNSADRGMRGKGGIALINSSPLGANFFYKMYLWGYDGNPDKDPQWQSFKWQHWDNPKNAEKGDELQKNGKTYRENLEIRMSSERYRQDYLAEFIIGGNSVFPDFEANCFVKPPSENKEEFIKRWREPKANYTYTIGFDPALVNDGSIIWIREDNTGNIVYMADLSGKDIETQCDEIQRLSKFYNYAVVKFGRTGLGMTIETLFANRGVPCVPYDEQGNNKSRYVENLAIAIRAGQLHILDDNSKIVSQVKYEFDDYTREVKNGKTVYHNATNNGHDDHISAAYFLFAGETVLKENNYGFYGLISAIE